MLSRSFATVAVVVLATAVAGSAMVASADAHDSAQTISASGVADTHGDHQKSPASGERGEGHLLGHCGGPVCWGSPATDVGVAMPGLLAQRPARPPRRSLPAGLDLAGDPPVPRLR
jgi:hypothetical protein